MATAAMIPLELYLRTNYEHDCEWVDGEVRERSMPDDSHSAVQAFFLTYFQTLRQELGIRARAELRLRVSERRYRIPDVLLMSSSVLPKPIPDTPPLLCIEVLSPDDRPGELQDKVADYLALGVGAIWIVDPRSRTLSTVDSDGTRIVQILNVPNSQRVLTPGEIFAEIDAYDKV